MGGRRHLLHRGGDLIGLDLLRLHAGAGLLGHRRQLLGGTGDLDDAVLHLANESTQGSWVICSMLSCSAPSSSLRVTSS